MQNCHHISSRLILTALYIQLGYCTMTRKVIDTIMDGNSLSIFQIILAFPKRVLWPATFFVEQNGLLKETNGISFIKRYLGWCNTYREMHFNPRIGHLLGTIPTGFSLCLCIMW